MMRPVVCRLVTSLVGDLSGLRPLDGKYTTTTTTAQYWGEHMRHAGFAQSDPELESVLFLYDSKTGRFRTWWQVYWIFAVENYCLGPKGVSALMVVLGHAEVIKKMTKK